MIVFENENNETVIEISHEDLFGTLKQQRLVVKETESFFSKAAPIYEGHEFDHLFKTKQIHGVLAIIDRNLNIHVGWVKDFRQLPLKEQPRDTYLLMYEVLNDNGARVINYKEFFGKANGPKHYFQVGLAFYNKINHKYPRVSFKDLKECLKGIKETFLKNCCSDEYIEKNLSHICYYNVLRKKAISELISGKVKEIKIS